MINQNLTTRQSIEFFHLLFLQRFCRVTNSKLFAIKGGCNLRFFFSSTRYSEDLDIDIKTVSVGTLAKNVDKILKHTSFDSFLRSRNLSINSVSSPKQTESVQRWKVGLSNTKLNWNIPTKIEFSRRGLDEGYVVDSVLANVIDEYSLPRMSASHYVAETAILQKIMALIGRSETQVRDVFDLDILISRTKKTNNLKIKNIKQDLKTAIDRLTELDFKDYQSHIVAYLDPYFQDEYARKEVWIEIKQRVQAFLESL